MAVLPLTVRHRPLAVLATAVAVLVGLLAALAPQQADAVPVVKDSPTTGLECVGALECVAFGATSVTDDTLRLGTPADDAFTLVPVDPADSGGTPGVFQLLDMNEETEDGDEVCLRWGQRDQYHEQGPETRQLLRGADMFNPGCDKKFHFLWVIEPVGDKENRGVDPQAWNPWTTTDAAVTDATVGKMFTIRPLISFRYPWRGAWCLQATIDGEDEFAINAVDTCGVPGTQLTLHQAEEPADPGVKEPAERQALQANLLGAAFASADWACQQRQQDNLRPDCKVRVADRNADDPEDGWVSEWSRFGEVILNRTPTPVVAGTGCAGGAGQGGAQAIFNSGHQPVTTTISASAANSASQSLTEGLSVSASLGVSASFFSAGVEVTKSVEHGQTWSETEEVSQDVSWTIPPQQYATAVIATDAVNLSATWQFGPDAENPWRLVNGAALDLPYSSTAGAVAPDTTMVVHNSWHPKNCNAFQPSTLAEDKAVVVKNQTAPGKAPIVGDTLTTDAGTSTGGGDAWWDVPSAGDDSPVRLRYRWYRVRSGEPAEPIPGAVGETTNPADITYTVTGDDVTDPEVLDRFGPYHIYVGVTDVADETRFDSLEYTSVATGGVTEGPRREPEGSLDLTIANPDAVATQDTRVDLAASVTGGDGAVDGEVTLLDGEEELTTVSLGSDGTKRVWLPLATGPHDLTAVYEGEGPLDGVRSSTVRTTVTAAPSSTALTARGKPSVGADTTLRADVKGAGPTPTGTVEFFDGVDSLGDPVELDADGTAELVVPGLSVGGSREVWATYHGDDIYAESRSEAVRQTAARAKTTTRVKGPRLSTAHRERTRLKSRVSVPGPAVPSGRVVFVADGRKVGLSRVDARGVATVRTRRLPLGRLKMWARFIPSSGSGFAASRSTTLRHQVRRHRSWVRGQLRDKRVRKRERVQVRGRVVLPNRRRMRPLRGKIELVHDGRRYNVKRIKRDGTYRVGMPARRLDKGRNVVKVVYHGSKRRSYRGWKRRSIAADTMRVVVRRR